MLNRVLCMQLTVEGEFYHKTCFRCSHGGCFLTISTYAALDGLFYCKHHFSQLFKEKGSYSHVLETAAMKKNGVHEHESAEAETPVDNNEQESQDL